MESSSHVCRPIQVLSARVDKVDHVLGDEGVIGFGGVVVNDGRIGSSSTNRLKTQSFIKLLCISAVIHVQGSIVLVNLIELGPPGPELGHCYPIHHMASLKPLNFFIRPHCPI